MVQKDRGFERWPLVALGVLALTLAGFVALATARGWSLAQTPSDLGLFGDFLGGVLGAGFGFLSLLLLTRSLREARASSTMAAAQAMIAGIEAMDRDLQSMLGRYMPDSVWIGESPHHPGMHWGPSIQLGGMARIEIRNSSLESMIGSVAAWKDAAKPLSPILQQRRLLAVSICRLTDTLEEFDTLSENRLRRFSDYYRARYRQIVDLLASQLEGLDVCADQIHDHQFGRAETEFNACNRRPIT